MYILRMYMYIYNIVIFYLEVNIIGLPESVLRDRNTDNVVQQLLNESPPILSLGRKPNELTFTYDVRIYYYYNSPQVWGFINWFFISIVPFQSTFVL